MNETLQEHLIEALDEGVRYDGRDKLEFRDISVETGVISTAEGSARVRCGETDVIAGVKLGLNEPYPDSPDEGMLRVNAERLPLSNPEFESGPPEIEAIEVSRVIDRGLRESGFIDTKALCIEPGEQVWDVSVDVVPMNHDGNLLDVGGLASLLALRDATFPSVEDGAVQYEDMTEEPLPLTDEHPVPVTVCKIGDHIIVDPTETEQRCRDSRITVTSLSADTICSMQKGGDMSLTFSEVNDMVDTAVRLGEELRRHV